MLRSVVVVTLAVLAAPIGAGAALTCPDRTPATITAAAAGSLKCQDAIAKAGAKFIAAKLKIRSKCKLSQPSGACPTATDTDKEHKAAVAAAASITKACGDNTIRAGLSSSYSTSFSADVIASCTLSQHNVVAALISAETNGVTTEPWNGSGKERATCVKEISKQGVKFSGAVLKAAITCLGKQSKAGTAGDLSPVCVGSVSGGSVVAPTDGKAAAAQANALAKTDAALAKKCGSTETLGQIASIFACAGASTVAELQHCVECNGLNGMFDAVEQEYAERGTFVAHAAGAIQTAVNAASAGDKLLIDSGDYQEEVSITTPNLSIVGCGGASDSRPKLLPTSPVVTGRGFQAAGIDGLSFQSLDFFDQTNDAIFVAQANGVTFRDITGDGNRHTRYAVFPVDSNNVLVELCRVVRQADAPLYIGQSSTIVVRHNDVREGVSSIEIENSGNAQVYDNYGTGNTAGLLVFKDGSLPVQLAQCHSVHHNLFENNNEPNFGAGTVSKVPTGTGILVLSADTTPYSYNLLRGNNTAGLVITDQVVGGFGPPYSSDESVDGNYVFDNFMANNGTMPDPDRWPLPFGADLVFLTSQSSGNCENGNVYMTQTGANAFHQGANTGTCVLPPPAVFPGCPAPPITTTTSTTSTTTTTDSTTSTTDTTTTTESSTTTTT
jgi:parallel beta-helix repeat protein